MMNSKVVKHAAEWELDEDRLDYAVEALALSVQFALQKAMSDNCISQKQLASRLGVSPARVSQYLAKDATNLTLKTIARIADALGEEFELFSLADIKELRRKSREVAAVKPSNVVNCNFQRKTRWKDESAANDRFSAEQYLPDLAYAGGR